MLKNICVDIVQIWGFQNQLKQNYKETVWQIIFNNKKSIKNYLNKCYQKNIRKNGEINVFPLQYRIWNREGTRWRHQNANMCNKQQCIMHEPQFI